MKIGKRKRKNLVDKGEQYLFYKYHNFFIKQIVFDTFNVICVN